MLELTFHAVPTDERWTTAVANTLGLAAPNAYVMIIADSAARSGPRLPFGLLPQGSRAGGDCIPDVAFRIVRGQISVAVGVLFGRNRCGTQKVASRDTSNLLKVSVQVTAWAALYNHLRPHQALGDRTPMAVWRKGMAVKGAVDMMTALVRTAWTQHSRWRIGRTTELTSADENGRTLQGPAL
jgi:hypothetical protein